MTTATLERPKLRPRHGKPALLPLRNGDHLSRVEFERRWEVTPGLKRAELIEGIVFMPPPTSDTHGERHGRIHHWLSLYAHATPGLRLGIAPSVRLDNKNEFQPDCVLRVEASQLGRLRVAVDDILEGAPELVTEVAVSSADYEAHEKREVYERAGIQEYLLWQVLDGRCDWLTLEEGQFVPLPPRADGVSCSQVFPGLWLDLPALVAGDERRVATVLTRGLNSAEHAAFVKKLAGK
jgi:Uma2 family endonuclease